MRTSSESSNSIGGFQASALIFPSAAVAILCLCLITCSNGLAALSEEAKLSFIAMGALLSVGYSLPCLKYCNPSFLLCTSGYFLVLVVEYLRFPQAFDLKVLFWQLSGYLCFAAGWSCIVVARRPPGIIMQLVILAFLCSSAAVYIAIANQAIVESGAGRISAAESLHPVGIAYAFGVAASVCLAMVVASPSKLLRILSIPCLGIVSLPLVTAASRGGIVAFLTVCASTIPILVKAHSSHPMRLIAGGIGLLLITVGLAGTFAVVYPDQINLIAKRFSDSGADTSSNERFEIWREYQQEIDNWLLFGMADYRDHEYPHNIFFELVIRLGIVGVVVGLGIVCLIALNYWSQLQDPANLTIAVASFAGIFALVNSQFNLSLDMNRALFFSVGVAIGKVGSDRQATRS